MTVDFTGSDPQVAGPFNCGDAITISACRLLIKCLTTPLDPVDEGCFRPLHGDHPAALGAGRARSRRRPRATTCRSTC